MTHAVLVWPAFAWTAYAWAAGMPDKLGPILDAAAARGMHVYVGLVASGGKACDANLSPNAEQDAAQTAAILDVLAARGWLAHPALAGWNIVNEPAVLYWGRDYAVDVAARYYRLQVDAIRTRSALPTLVAPYACCAGEQQGEAVTLEQAVQQAADFAAA